MISPKGRILCTEDDPDTRELIKLVLSTAGYDVDCVDTAKNALALLRANKFDLCLLDNWLPDGSGVELCQKITAFHPHLPVLFYSGAGFEADKQRAKEAGAHGYMVKPVPPEELVGAVSRLLDN